MADPRARLRSSDPEERRKAVQDAGSLDLLIQALGDDSWRVRKLAARRLSSWKVPEDSAAALVQVIAETDEVGLRNSALEALARLGPTAVTALTDALSPQQVHRKFFLDALGALGDRSAVPAVLTHLTDPDANVRVAAAESLGRLGGPDSTKALLECASSSEMMVQLTALDALAEAGAQVPVQQLLSWVDTPVVRVSALRLLGNARDTRAVPTLIAALGDKTRRAREAAIEALARFTGDDASASDAALLQPEIAALHGSPVDNLVAALQARTPEVRRSAARLLGLGRHRSTVPQLAAGLLDPESGAACSRAIEAMGPEAMAAADHAAPPSPGGAVEMSQAEFVALRDLFRDHCGIDFPRDGAYLLRRRLASRLTESSTANFTEYHRLLRSGETREQELAAAVDCITTNETYFFREAYQLRAFRDEILPDLRARGDRRDQLNVWSAGCSTGEEAYTIAMLVRDAGGFEDWDVRVMGTDISQRVLEVARSARYTSGSLRAHELTELRRFIRPLDDGNWRVRDEVKRMVSFNELNLIDVRRVLRMPRADVIFCRNVLMYFDRATRMKVVASFYDRLERGGYLLLGHTDSLINLTTAFELVQLRNDTVYRKPL